MKRMSTKSTAKIHPKASKIKKSRKNSTYTRIKSLRTCKAEEENTNEIRLNSDQSQLSGSEKHT